MYPEPIEDDRQTTGVEHSLLEKLSQTLPKAQGTRVLTNTIFVNSTNIYLQILRGQCCLQLPKNKPTLSFVQTITNCVLRKTVAKLSVVTNLLTCYQPGVNALLNTNISNISININNN